MANLSDSLKAYQVLEMSNFFPAVCVCVYPFLSPNNSFWCILAWTLPAPSLHVKVISVLSVCFPPAFFFRTAKFTAKYYHCLLTESRKKAPSSLWWPKNSRGQTPGSCVNYISCLGWKWLPYKYCFFVSVLIIYIHAFCCFYSLPLPHHSETVRA